MQHYEPLDATAASKEPDELQNIDAQTFAGRRMVKQLSISESTSKICEGEEASCVHRQKVFFLMWVN